MTYQDWLAAREIGTIFAEEIQAAGGRVTETIDANPLFFARSVLPGTREVTKGDRVQGGVALRGSDEEILVHPYVFRQVCTNGAIRAHAIQTRRIVREEFPEFAGDAIATALREAIRAGCSREAFAEGVDEMRAARLDEVDVVLALAPMLSRMAPALAAEMLGSIMGRYTRGRDRSRFGLMNAVTSLARDTRDPEGRWRLEEFGGGIPVAPPRRGPELDVVRLEVAAVV
jgi:hypothetical protein